MGEIPWSDFIVTPPSFPNASPFCYGNEYAHVPVPPPDFSSCFITPDSTIDTIDFGQCKIPAHFPPPAADFNEIENRAVSIVNVDPDTPRDEIERVFRAVGAVRTLDAAALSSGSLTVEYFDLRHAVEIRRNPIPIVLNGSPVTIGFAPLPPIEDPRNPPNNGTIVVFHLPTGITNQQIEATFRPFGDIREVRVTPSKPNQKFIEYWDLRDAQKALDTLNGQYLMGSRVSIEFSLPGGFRRNAQQPGGRLRF
jgi:hypothetical protein